MGIALLLAASLQTGSASAGVLILSTPGSSLGFSTDISFGYQFTVGAASITVGSLGVWDQSQDGLSEAHPVSIYGIDGTLLATTTVPSGTSAP